MMSNLTNKQVAIFTFAVGVAIMSLISAIFWMTIAKDLSKEIELIEQNYCVNWRQIYDN